MTKDYSKAGKNWKDILHEIIFEADTPGGKVFDVILLIAIILSVVAVMLESVAKIKLEYGHVLYIAEWVFTILFTIEYVTRLLIVTRPFKYAISFLGIIDLLSVIPTYLSLIFVGAQSLLVIRSIRLLRVFRVFKLARFLGEASQLMSALKASRPKIIVFIGAVFTMVVILGTLMYLIEGGENGFTSIPKSIYWAVVTLTTVGYGDIAPQTVLGQGLATLIMILGYGIIAVPTGIVSAEMTRQKPYSPVSTQACPHCGAEGHDSDAAYCKKCGGHL
ncbi:Potassium voltage-gated channel subfamily KQT [Fulvivirga imtechensis AK7]|uniref:Potassium voltage-gated channel subfamily KQT n=1 Tax=Fulvivirga imtechensis AK7 TaxID=1237149 RepID=L8JH58_9BACT|nr:ion transporter [Fulvivirga imtechensis]ELR68160.1 Potassium voltage-gated channel subfamily KQT [Fulvivirga imtechensis AK7]